MKVSMSSELYESLVKIGHSVLGSLGTDQIYDEYASYDSLGQARKLSQQDREEIIHEVLISLIYGKSGESFQNWCLQNPSLDPKIIYFSRLKQQAKHLLNRSFRSMETDLEKADRLTCEIGTCEGILDALHDSEELIRIVELIEAGYTQKEIGKELGMRDRTVRRRMKVISEVLTSYYFVK